MPYAVETLPRPREDTGLLWHLPPVVSMSVATLRYYLTEIHAMGGRWVVGMLDDPAECIAICAELGMFYIYRPFARASSELTPSSLTAQLCQQYGMPAIYLLYNEPESFLEEWVGGPPDPEWAKVTWANRWIAAAKMVFNFGGWPAIQTNDPEWLRYLLERIRDECPEILARTIIASHNYCGEHPPPYPYDARNQQDHPGATIEDDWYAFLQPLKLDAVARAVLRQSLPVIVTEGGWTIGTQEERGNLTIEGMVFRYPRITYKEHREYHMAARDMMATGTMPNGEALPDWWVCVGFWLVANQQGGGGDQRFEECAWYSDNLSGTKWDTINAFKAAPRYVRQLQDETPEPDPEPEPTPAPEGFEFELAFQEYAEQFPERVGAAAGPMVQVTPDEVTQRTERGVLWYRADTGVTFYVAFAEAAEVAQLRQELAGASADLASTKLALDASEKRIEGAVALLTEDGG